MIRGIRFGISVPGAPSADGWIDRARRAEAGGFDILLLPEHLGPSMFAPFPAIAAAAEQTTALRFGTLVANNDLRHPAVLAREAATLDLLTDGRFELGLGAGYRRSDYEQAGFEFSRPGTRVERLSESIDVIRGLWRGAPVEFRGVHHQVNGHTLAVSPTASAIRLLVGGNGRRLLSLAARKADTVNFVGVSQRSDDSRLEPTHFTRTGLANQIGWVHEAAGRRFPELELSILVQQVEITSKRRAAAHGVQAWMPGVSTAEVLDSPYVLIGTRAQIAGSIIELKETLGVTYVVFLGTSWSAAETVLDSM